MKKEEFFRFNEHKKIVINYVLSRVALALSLMGAVLIYLVLLLVEKDVTNLSSQVATFFLQFCLAICIFTILITLFIWIPDSGNKYEYVMAKAKLKIINEMAE